MAPAVQRANALTDLAAKRNALLAVQGRQRHAAAGRLFARLNERDKTVDGTLRAMAVFCHGFSDGCEAGLINENAAQFARAVHAATAPAGGHAHPAARDLRLVLYCCLCGHSHPSSESVPEADGHNSLAAEHLCAALRDAGLAEAQVDAHILAGHAVRNTTVRRFFVTPPGDTSAGSTYRGIYRESMVSPRHGRAMGDVSGRALFYVWYSMLVPHDNPLDMHFRKARPPTRPARSAAPPCGCGSRSCRCRRSVRSSRTTTRRSSSSSRRGPRRRPRRSRRGATSTPPDDVVSQRVAGDPVRLRGAVWVWVALAACRRPATRVVGAPRPAVSAPRDVAVPGDAAVPPERRGGAGRDGFATLSAEPPRGVVAARGAKHLEVVDLAAHPRAGVVVASSEWTPSPPESDVDVGYASNFARALAWDTLAPAGAPVDACPRDIHALIQSGQLQGAPLASTATGVSGACCRFANRETGGLVVACDTWAVKVTSRTTAARAIRHRQPRRGRAPPAGVVCGGAARRERRGVAAAPRGRRSHPVVRRGAAQGPRRRERGALGRRPRGSGRALLALANTTQLAAVASTRRATRWPRCRW